MKFRCFECGTENNLVGEDITNSKHDVVSASDYSEQLCMACDMVTWVCHYCQKSFSKRGRKRSRIVNHIKSCKLKRKSDCLDPNESLKFVTVRNNKDGTTNSDSNDIARAAMSDGGDDDSSISDVIESQDPFEFLCDEGDDFFEIPPPAVQLDIGRLFPNGNSKTEAYFGMEHMGRESGQNHCGIRGIAWRTLFRKQLFGLNNTSSEKEARLLLNMANHLVEQTEGQREDFFEIFEDLFSDGMKSNMQVQIPQTTQEANSILLNGQYGLMNNLPHEDVKVINDHACVSLVGLFRQVFARHSYQLHMQ